MSRKGSLSTSSRRGSAVGSTTSSTSTVSTIAPTDPKIKIFSPDGPDLSCEITVRFSRATITLKERGQKLQARGSYPRELLVQDPFSGPVNQDRMDSWHCSMINEVDENPTGRSTPYMSLTRRSRDPGHLLYLYKDHLNCLEVLTGADTSGKWMLRPIAVEKRQAIYNAIQTARANSKQAQVDQALSFLKLAEDEDRLKKARLDRQARKKAKAEEAALRKQAATHRRQNSADSSGSMYKSKGARVSVSSLASTQTSSTTLPRYSTNDVLPLEKRKEDRSLRHRIFRKKA